MEMNELLGGEAVVYRGRTYRYMKPFGTNKVLLSHFYGPLIQRDPNKDHRRYGDGRIVYHAEQVPFGVSYELAPISEVKEVARTA